MKMMDVTTFNAIKSASGRHLRSGVIVGNLENGGVAWRPSTTSTRWSRPSSRLSSTSSSRYHRGAVAEAPADNPLPQTLARENPIKVLFVPSVDAN